MEYEILAPAGNLLCAEAAINSGANAIYLGLSAFSARANAENFDETALSELIKRAHFLDVKIYVAMNTIVKESEREEFLHALLKVWSLGVNAIILQDIFFGKAVHENYPEIVLHLSTQAGVCNVEGAKFAKECGFSRVILARETPLSEIKKIAEIIETETFVQGALCTSYSGQCYFSSFAGGNSGNRGRCKQPCRKLYSYNRTGYEERAYALSLSDLCVGDDIEKLKAAGVVSFKIEGRMRRAEYVAAAVKYYRLLLDGGKDGEKSQAFGDLKRTYNRGNYTKGLAFSQDKRFLSRAVQGHLGEKVGVVKVENGNYLVESAFACGVGDAFKIFRKGKEIGGAAYAKPYKRGFILSSKTRLLAGDNVFITTSAATNERLLKGEKRKKLSLSLRFTVGEKAVVSGGGVEVQSEWIAESASSRPITAEEIKACFLKTDSLPLEIEFSSVQIVGEMFVPKSLLNAFRRDFYVAVWAKYTGNEHKKLLFSELLKEKIEKKTEEKIAVISGDFSFVKEGDIDVAIYKPSDYNLPLDEDFIKGNFEKYLYLPAFATQEDLEKVKAAVQANELDGVYAENYGGIAFANENGFSVFAGTGFNLTNAVAISELKKIPCVKYYAISKELDERAQQALMTSGGFVLSSGNLKLMDLCYCPFEKSCKACDKREVYTLTDESGRAFPIRRYKGANGECRFEVYNCANLIGKGVNGGKILDCTLMDEREKVLALQAKADEEKQKSLYQNYTSGHGRKSVL